MNTISGGTTWEAVTRPGQRHRLVPEIVGLGDGSRGSALSVDAVGGDSDGYPSVAGVGGVVQSGAVMDHVAIEVDRA